MQPLLWICVARAAQRYRGEGNISKTRSLASRGEDNNIDAASSHPGKSGHIHKNQLNEESNCCVGFNMAQWQGPLAAPGSSSLCWFFSSKSRQCCMSATFFACSR